MKPKRFEYVEYMDRIVDNETQKEYWAGNIDEIADLLNELENRPWKIAKRMFKLFQVYFRESKSFMEMKSFQAILTDIDREFKKELKDDY